MVLHYQRAQFCGLVSGNVVEEGGFRHHPDGAATVRKWNQPVPDVVVLGMYGDANLVAVELRIADAIGDMREISAAQRKTGRTLEIEQAGEHAAETAGVEDEAGFDRVFAAIGIAHLRARTFTFQINCGHALAIAYLGALQFSLLRQQMIEVGALHLIGRAPSGGMLVAEIERSLAFAADEGCAILELEAVFHDGLQHAGLFQIGHALRQQTLTDGKARKLLALDDEYLMAATAQQSGGNCTGRACADDQDVVLLGIASWCHKLAVMSRQNKVK